MRIQLHLFEKNEPRWAKRILKTIEAKRREELVRLLAEMGKSAIEANRKREKEERNNEPREDNSQSSE